MQLFPVVPAVKRRVVKQRVRVSRACDYCKRKKIGCTGTQPCRQCVREGLVCEYKAPYGRGKKKVVQQQCTPTSSLAVDPEMEDRYQRSTEPLSRTSPDPGEQDRQGHFVGASSGLSFLLRLQRRLKQDLPATSVFTLGDAVLPAFEEAGFSPPPKTQAEALLKTYFELASPTYRFLHRPTVERWLCEFYESGTVSGEQSHSKYAVLLTMFAQAVRYTGAASNSPDAETGVQYFQAAERELSHETQSPTLTSVQALLGSCFYVLTRSRLNHCWSLFGTTARLILALGMHRKNTRLSSSSNLVEKECRKRLFWCAYNLDKYLSAILGRPCAFHDDDIDQDMPSLVEDSNLTADACVITGETNMNVMLGPLHHQKLGRILSTTLRRLYGITPLDRASRHRAMDELGAQVDAWRDALPAFLNPAKVDSRLLIPLFQRQSNLLSLAASHAEMLIFRPSLLNNGAYAPRCLVAARAIVEVIDRMHEARQLFAASWFSHYQAFCAVVVLYTCSRGEAEHVHAAERCQRLIASVASGDSLAQRFGVIMEELRREVRPEQDEDMFRFLELPNWEQLDSLALDLGGLLPELGLGVEDFGTRY